MRAKSLPGLAIAGLFGVLTAACSGGGTPSVTTAVTSVVQAPPIATANLDRIFRIGVLLPTTGSAKALAQPMITAIGLAEQEINAAGGVFGRPVEIYMRDEGGDTISATSAFAQLVDVDRVDAIVGPSSSRVALGLIESIKRRKMPTCSPATTAIDLSTPADGNFFFRTIPSDELEARAIAEAIDKTGRKSVAIVYPDDDFGAAMNDFIRLGLQRKGTSIRTSEAYDPSATKFNELAKRVFTSPAPDSIALVGLAEPGAQVLGALRAEGGPRVQMVVSAGLRRSNLFEAIPGGKPDILGEIRGVSPAAWSFRSSWTAKFAQVPGAGSEAYASYAYDCAMLLALAATTSDNEDGVAIAQNVVPNSVGGTNCAEFAACIALIKDDKNIDLFGASGQLDLNVDGDPQSGRYDLFTFDANGRDVSGDTAIDVG
jgi:branched-chain amino acid transport system substrate-binding protein